MLRSAILATVGCLLLAQLPSAFADCGNQQLLRRPSDPSQRGPWAVGATTLYGVSSRNLTVEVWYPAQPGSEFGKSMHVYDIREFIPDKYRDRITDEKNPPHECDCYRDLPVDIAHGPYPVIEFIHGTAAFRTQSLHLMTHLASRGFIVVAMDCPGVYLKDFLLKPSLSYDQFADAKAVLGELSMLMSEPAFSAFRFLDRVVDMSRIGIMGHSVGGMTAARMTDYGDVIIELSAFGEIHGKRVKSVLAIGARDDGVMAFPLTESSYGVIGTPFWWAPKLQSKRLMRVDKAGHLMPSDLCYIGREQGGLVHIAIEAGIQEAHLLSLFANDGCKAGQLPAEIGWNIVNYAVTAELEETLFCEPASKSLLDGIRANLPQVGLYRHHEYKRSSGEGIVEIQS